MSKRILQKKTFIGIALFMLLLILFFLFFGFYKTAKDKPVLAIETPQKINLSETEEITLDITVSRFGKDIYPAASMSISFDPSRLEFMGIKEGNVFVTGTDEGVPQILPEWSSNPVQANKSGKINLMYLDTTGGRKAFTKELLKEEDNVVLRLNFRLRGSLRRGDVCDLIFDDAVFASSDESKSLAMTTNTLKVRNAKIVIGG